MQKLVWTVAALMLPAALHAQATRTGSTLAGLSFMLGDWQSGQGQVADTGGTAKGQSAMTLEAGGNVLLRRDHTDLFDKLGKPTGSFEQVMMIYPEAGTLHAEYSDGQHVIHYVSADVVAGRSVTFTSASQPNAPTFRLQYSLTAPRTLSVAFRWLRPEALIFILSPRAVSRSRARLRTR